MGTAELKVNLHKIVDRIDDEGLLRAIYSFLNQRDHAEEGKMWRSLTDDQRREVLQAYEESEDDSKLIADEDVWNDIK